VTDRDHGSYFSHLTADFSGVAPAKLRDRSAVGGVMVAAAGAAGLATVAPPAVHSARNDGLAAILMLDRCHLSVHTFPELGVLLLDVLAAAPLDARKVVEVFERRLGSKKVVWECHRRG